MSEYAVLPLSDYTEACEAAREMTGTSDKITSGQLAGKIRSISKGENLDDELENQDDLIEDIMAALQGKAAGSGGSDPVIQSLTVTENGTYTAPGGVDGYSPVVVDVPIPDVPEAVDQATPVITVSESGLITAKATQEAGAVAAGTKSATKQLTTKGATTITPGPSEQTAVAAGTFVTGDIKVAPVANEDLEAILDEQEELIATLQATLQQKAEGGGGSIGGISKYAKIVAKPASTTSFVIENPLGGIAKQVLVRRTATTETENKKIQMYIADRDYGLGVVELISTSGTGRYPVTKAEGETLGNSQFAMADGVIELYRYNSANTWDADSEYEVEIYESDSDFSDALSVIREKVSGYDIITGEV